MRAVDGAVCYGVVVLVVVVSRVSASLRLVVSVSVSGILFVSMIYLLESFGDLVYSPVRGSYVPHRFCAHVSFVTEAFKVSPPSPKVYVVTYMHVNDFTFYNHLIFSTASAKCYFFLS